MKSIARVGLAFFLSVLLSGAQTAPSSPAAATPEKPKEPTASQEFKNIQVLKDVPVKQWFPTMAFIAGSLGVGCEHCHVNPFASDEKPTKKRAREMMRMVAAINQQTFPEQPNRVTCMTCHRGSTKPERTPSIATAGWLKEFIAATQEKPPAPAPPPDAQQVIAKYRAAIGATNVGSVRSRYYKGTVTSYNASSEGPRSFEQMVYLAGDQVRLDLTDKQGTQSNIYDGRRGWLVTPKQTRPMNDDEIANLRASVLRALKMDYLPQFTQATTKGAEEVRGHQSWAVEFTMADSRTETYFFDQQTGLLVMRRGSVPSAFANFPEETWFDDYRRLGGVTLPFTVISAAVSHGIVRRYDEIQVNRPIEPSKFASPAGSAGTEE